MEDGRPCRAGTSAEDAAGDDRREARGYCGSTARTSGTDGGETGTDGSPKVAREQLLAARRVNEREWQVNLANGSVTMLPFTWLGSRHYTTYLKLS